MSQLLLLFLIGMSGFVSSEALSSQIVITDVTVPKGYTEKSEAVVTVSGFKPNPCYGDVEIEVNQFGNDIELKAFSESNTEFICPMVIEPFIEKVRLGKLGADRYQITYLTEGDERDLVTFEVLASIEEIIKDDHVLGEVKSVRLSKNGERVLLSVVENNSCSAFDSLKVLKSENHAYTLIPLVEKSEKEVCAPVQNTKMVFWQVPQVNESVHIHVKTANDPGRHLVLSPDM